MVPNGTAYAEFPSFADSGTRVKPSPDSRYAQGFVPGDTFPAEWENYFMHGATAGITRLNADTLSIKEELNNILSEYGITPNASAINQLYTVLRRIAPQICTCDTAAGTETKSVAITGDGTTLKAGNIYSITMTHENTYGNGSSTYPKLSINNGTAYPMCDARGAYLKSGAWAAGDVVTVLFTGSKFLKNTVNIAETVENGNTLPVSSNAVNTYGWNKVAPYGLLIDAETTELTGSSYTFTPASPAGMGNLEAGSVVRITFKNALQSSAAITQVSLTFGGRTGVIKAQCALNDGVNPITDLQPLKSHVFTGGNYSATYFNKVWDAYTTLELMWTGTEWLVMGDTVLCSYFSETQSYTIKSNGLIEQWGYTPSALTAGKTIYLFPAYSNSNYSISVSVLHTGGPANETVTIKAINNDNFVTASYNSRAVYWYAIGY
jgi:hypothetical protein